MGRHRQSLELACRPPMMALVITLGLGLSAPAQAELAVQLVWSPTATTAPAQLVLTASVSGDDPALEYAWQGLDGWPPCAGPRCDLAMPLASCRRVGLQVTGLSGALASAEAQVCADDEAGSPPQAHMELQMLSTGLRVRRGSTPGGAEILASHLFVDEVQVHEPFAFLESDEGCHAVDLIVVDALGRIGQDRRQACFSEVAPRVRLGAQPAVVTQEQLQRVCAELQHPLGLSISQVAGPQLSEDDCALAAPAPQVLSRPIMRVQDERDVSSTGSLWVVRAPESGPATLPWLVPATGPWQFGRVIAVDILGGLPPYELQAEVGIAGLRWPVPAEPTEQAGRWLLQMPNPAVSDVDFVITATVQDARALGTYLEAPILAASAATDAGVPQDGGVPAPTQDLSSSCSNLTPQGAWHYLGLLVFVALHIRRRR